MGNTVLFRRVLLSVTLLLCTSVLYAQSLDSLHLPQVWFRADKGELTQTQWTDFTGYKRHATALPNQAPLKNALFNYNPAVTFDGQDDYLSIPYSVEGLAEITMLGVFYSADTTERGVWGAENPLSRNIMLTTRRSAGPDSVVDNYGKNEKLAVLSSILQSWTKTTEKNPAAFLALGSAGKQRSYKPFKGSLAELLVFNTRLDFLARVQYETYLGIKYGIPLSSGNYVSSQQQVLWNAEANKTFGNRMAGIGRDDAFQLYQRQSFSTIDKDSLIVISAGALAKTNAENSANINNGDFLIWGDNAQALTFAPTSEKPGDALSLSNRKWLMDASGATVSKIETQLLVDISQFPYDSLGYWLVIDRSGSSDFSVDNLEYVFAEKVTGGKALYKVKWDADGSGQDHFAFAKARSFFTVVRTLQDPSCTDETAGKVSIEVVSGKMPLYNRLKHVDGKISREWQQSSKTADQNDLVDGDYTLTAKSADGEVLVREFSLRMPDALHIDLGPDQQLSNNDIVLDVSSQIPDSIEVSYRWENSFGFSSTDQKVIANETGIYHVYVTKAKDGCVFTDDIAITGADAQRVAVFPSVVKSNDPYNISVSLRETGSVGVKIFNSRGVMMQDMSGSSNSEYQFKTSMNDTGLYLVVIQTPTGMETRKVVVY